MPLSRNTCQNQQPNATRNGSMTGATHGDALACATRGWYDVYTAVGALLVENNRVYDGKLSPARPSPQSSLLMTDRQDVGTALRAPHGSFRLKQTNFQSSPRLLQHTELSCILPWGLPAHIETVAYLVLCGLHTDATQQARLC